MGRFAQFKADILQYLEEEAPGTQITQPAHYARNTLQRDDIRYFEVLTARSGVDGFTYELVSDAKSALHRFGTGNENNAKWVAADDGSEEYIFRYSGNAMTGQFVLLTESQAAADASPYVVRDDRNAGTYNFASGKTEAALHTAWDIYPWILWGSSEYDATQWTSYQRFDAFWTSIGAGAYTTFEEGVLDRLNALDNAGTSLLRLFGVGGDDMLVGSEQAQEFRAKGGSDTVDYSAAPGAVTASLERGPHGEGFDGWARGDTYKGVENLTGSSYGDILIGNELANTLKGGDGADIIAGMGGDDTIDGGAHANTIKGGRGDDTIFVHNTATTVDGGAGKDTVVTTIRLFSVDPADFTGVEVYRQSEDFIGTTTYMQGSDRAETLIGNSATSYLYGYGGNDILVGGAGNDGMQGGIGNDTYSFETGWGQDRITEEGGQDRLVFEDLTKDDLRLARDIGVNSGHLNIYNKTTGDKVFVWNHFSVGKARIEKLVAIDGEIDLRFGLELEGTSGSDSIQGTRYSDYMLGLGGMDTLRGGNGRDVLEGGALTDQLQGGAGNDTYVFKPGFGHDYISEYGRYQGEKDSGGDVIAMYGINPANVEIETDFQGRQTIRVLDALGNTTDSIFIWAQSWNYGSGQLVEWIQFDDGALMPLVDTI
jgi:Ca2+-binding RTX toxin-like protein